MANTHTSLTALFTAIANAIRAKTGEEGALKADDFPTAIANIPTGGSSRFGNGVGQISTYQLVTGAWKPSLGG